MAPARRALAMLWLVAGVGCVHTLDASRTTDDGAVPASDAGGPEAPADGGLGLPTAPVACPALPILGGAVTGKTPAEWFARNFAEALGRLPSQDEWNFSLAAAANTCSADSLKAAASLYNSDEFLALPYNARERSLAMYRGLIGHDPSADELDRFAAWQDAKPDGLCETIAYLVRSQQFASHTKDICSPALANYHYEKGFPAIGAGEKLPEATLREWLAAAKSGDVVELPRGAWVEVTSPLRVPTGVTLRTEGMTTIEDRRAYARMARLIRKSSFRGPIVQTQEGATLETVWLDGRIADFAHVTDKELLGPNVFTDPTVAAASAVRFIRTDNPASAQNIRVGSYNKKVCTKPMTVNGNFVVNSGNDNRVSGPRPIWSDGVFVHCETSVVEDNEVLDPSDVGLILFVSENGKQRSTITNNRVLSAGNDAFGGLVIDTWTGFRCNFEPCDFSGAGFTDNILWSGPNTRFVFAISTASSPWSFIPGHGTARGAKFIHNTSGKSRIRTQVTFYGAHLLNATVDKNWDGKLIDNVGPAGSVPANRCAIGATLVEKATTSGSFQAHANASRTDCI